MDRLQELQFTVAGGTKLVSGVNLSPRSTTTYLRTSLRCKQESIRIKNSAQKTSPLGKFPKPANLGGEWRQMSLPAMFVGETVIEILQASQFAREIVSSVGAKSAVEDPKTPLSRNSYKKEDSENTQLRAKRRKEKQNKQQSDSPPLPSQRVRSRINFKVSPPKKVKDLDKEKEKNKYLANRVSPRNRPWARKTVLFPNPLFSSTSSHQQQFCKTRSPVISRNRATTTPHKFRIKSPHKFLIETPNSVTSTTPHKFRILSPHKFLIKSPASPKRPTRLNSPKRCGAASKSSRPLSPPRLVAPTKSKRSVQKSDGLVCLNRSSLKSKKNDGLVCLSKSSPKRSTASKLRRSFSPSRMVTRLVSPLKSKKNVQKVDGFVSGLKQRPATTVQLPGPKFKNIL